MKALLLFLSISVMLCGCAQAEVRQPAVSGSFYPFSPDELRSQVDKFINEAEDIEVPGQIIALVVPHAGYIYSGRTAGYAYKKIKGKKFDTVILIGPCHRQRFGGVSVGDYDSYRTPLGEIKVDKEMVNALKSSCKDLHAYKGAHALEHCLEVQLPFLQQALGDFKIVTLLMGEESIKTSSWLGKAIAENANGKNILIIASTDLSHYHPYDMAVRMDKETVDQILRLDSASFLIASAEGKCESCGAGATASAITAAKHLGANKAKLLKYENSGDTAGDKSSVVGYAAIAIYKGTDTDLLEEFAPLDEAQQKKLLEIARQSIEGYVTEGRVPEFKVDDPVLLEKRGVFVTIFEVGDLRGCIGTHTSDMPLYRTVSDMAVESACRDPRFVPMSKDELDRIKVKVSVYLMEPTRIEGPDQIILGEHGIIFKKGLRSSTFLPEVAIEQGWDKETTLRHLAMKAGLPADAYKSGAEFYVYKTQVFGE